MLKPLTLLTLLLLPAAATLAQPAISYPPVAPLVSIEAVMQLPVGKPVALHRYGTAPSQYAELWLPAGTRHKLPVVAFIHGGCWLSEYSIEHSHALATALTQAGYAVWNIEYRRVGESGGGWPGSLQDITAALELLHTLQTERIDLTAMVIAGHSAGGHLALLSATKNSRVIGLAPIVDIAEYARGTSSCNTAAVQFMGGTPNKVPALYQAATPATPGQQSNYRVLMGTQDHIVPAQTDYLPTGYLQWSDAGHFDWIHPGTPAWQEFLDQLQNILP